MSEMCPICERSFASAADLLDHTKHRHAKAAPEASFLANPEAHRPGFPCSLCGRRFGTAEELSEHNLAPHPRATRKWMGAARA
jgi:Zinc finger, C2H2 type/C2H2-type zinc finger